MGLCLTRMSSRGSPQNAAEPFPIPILTQGSCTGDKVGREVLIWRDPSSRQGSGAEILPWLPGLCPSALWPCRSAAPELGAELCNPTCRAAPTLSQPCLIPGWHTPWMGKAEMARFAAFIKIIPDFGLCPSSGATLTKGDLSQGELLVLQGLYSTKQQETLPSPLHFWAFTQLGEQQFSQTVECEKCTQTPWTITIISSNCSASNTVYSSLPECSLATGKLDILKLSGLPLPWPCVAFQPLQSLAHFWPCPTYGFPFPPC